MLTPQTNVGSALLCAAVSGAVELRNEVSRAVGMDLPGTLVFDYPTPAAIAAFVVSKQMPTSASTAAPVPPSEAAPAAALRCALFSQSSWRAA